MEACKEEEISKVIIYDMNFDCNIDTISLCMLKVEIIISGEMDVL